MWGMWNIVCVCECNKKHMTSWFILSSICSSPQPLPFTCSSAIGHGPWIIPTHADKRHMWHLSLFSPTVCPHTLQNKRKISIFLSGFPVKIHKSIYKNLNFLAKQMCFYFFSPYFTEKHFFSCINQPECTFIYCLNQLNINLIQDILALF